MSFADDFNRSNGALGSNYDTVSGVSTLNVSSNQAKASGVGVCANTVKSTVYTAPNDQYVQVDLAALSGFDFVGLIVRCDPVAVTGYLARMDGTSGGANKLYSFSGGLSGDSLTALSSTVITPEVAETAVLKAIGSQISIEIDGSEVISVTDETYTSGQPGLYYDFQGGNSSAIDNFFADAAGATSSSGLLLRRRRAVLQRQQPLLRPQDLALAATVGARNRRQFVASALAWLMMKTRG